MCEDGARLVVVSHRETDCSYHVDCYMALFELSVLVEIQSFVDWLRSTKIYRRSLSSEGSFLLMGLFIRALITASIFIYHVPACLAACFEMVTSVT